MIAAGPVRNSTPPVIVKSCDCWPVKWVQCEVVCFRTTRRSQHKPKKICNGTRCAPPTLSVNKLRFHDKYQTLSQRRIASLLRDCDKTESLLAVAPVHYGSDSSQRVDRMGGLAECAAGPRQAFKRCQGEGPGYSSPRPERDRA